MKYFFTSLTSKVLETKAKIYETKYGVLEPEIYETKYGIYEPKPTIDEKIINIGKFILPIILFLIGLFVVLNKKIPKKVKIIVVSILTILLVLGYILIKYFTNNI